MRPRNGVNRHRPGNPDEGVRTGIRDDDQRRLRVCALPHRRLVEQLERAMAAEERPGELLDRDVAHGPLCARQNCPHLEATGSDEIATENFVGDEASLNWLVAHRTERFILGGGGNVARSLGS